MAQPLPSRVIDAAVVQPVRHVLPELESRRDQPVAAPVRRARDDLAREPRLLLGQAPLQHAALRPAGGTGPMPRRRGGKCAGGWRNRRPTSASVTASTTVPSMRTCRRSAFQWNSSAARGLAARSSPLRLSCWCRRRSRARSCALQQHDARRRRPVGGGGGERHGVRRRSARCVSASAIQASNRSKGSGSAVTAGHGDVSCDARRALAPLRARLCHHDDRHSDNAARRIADARHAPKPIARPRAPCCRASAA